MEKKKKQNEEIHRPEGYLHWWHLTYSHLRRNLRK